MKFVPYTVDDYDNELTTKQIPRQTNGYLDWCYDGSDDSLPGPDYVNLRLSMQNTLFLFYCMALGLYNDRDDNEYHLPYLEVEMIRINNEKRSV